MHDRAVVRGREIEAAPPSIVLDAALLTDMLGADGFGIVTEALHDPTLEVELELVLEVVHDHDALGDLWFLASEDVVAATEAVWLPPPAEARLAVPTRLALIGAGVAAVVALLAATV